MFRASILSAIVLAIAAIATPASAFSTQTFGATNREVAAHFHPITSVQKSYLHPPSKKKPL
ncbi:hypothetical protein JQ621_29710 [Bradyrhizobium manausense]|uniref:hypothetical protein n=1 Tax=Bradyrhizobium manausense TaxID=989370 RepID=UPI001BA86ADD|nr:hypothetical protein [Bradyrhizobium manausense]MBR1091653.1 hypothetical protein [Bradyrhizobium manausense]